MPELERRRFLQIATLAGAVTVAPARLLGAAPAQASPRGTLNPSVIRKYETRLVIPPAMPPTSVTRGLDYYEIAVRQFRQQILPSGLPATTVWGYGSINHRGTFNYPAFTINARHRRPVRVKWINDLVDRNGDFLPHLLPVDQTLHWANPPGGISDRDSNGTSQQPYRGPVPIVTHVHGNHTFDYSDGYPEAWYLPKARNIPAGFAREGTFYNFFKEKSPIGDLWSRGNAVFQYANDQPANTQWYHDHTLGMTRANVYAGPAGFYLLRGGPGDLQGGRLPGPAPQVGDRPGTRYYEIPLAVQDRSFNYDGSLFYPRSRTFFDGFPGPYAPTSDVPPIWNPEFFGNTIVVNGRTWPVHEVEPRRYRFRILNGCDSRFLIFKLASNPWLPRPVKPVLPIWMIGAEGGFLPAPVRLDQLLLAPAERADVIVDFTGLPVGTEIYLINEGPDAPFPGPPDSFADPLTTGQVMKFEVVRLTSHDTSTPPSRLNLPHFQPLGPAVNHRKLSLTEQGSVDFPDVSPVIVQLGTVKNGVPNPLLWSDPITEDPILNTTEVWELYNFTADAHPIHIHEVQFQVVDRQPFDGGPRPPEPWERGFKDTVIAPPGEITRVKATFDLPGRYVWHCHILEHEDNEMMRPYQIIG
ncbi:multicopper oxidase family protein [Nonomuraea roseoviolacea]|uniref:FtsP/CotA-like multicopper oxidase with cupredoxin domain n=1 Tax=Nonomuraea roseoviolacea subsp. carminata TaxID=160689 RepID=A0ABT1K170_9ACTN|nr:multicopper oxidase [Nonomuraea roseoviolacea]MCP2347741.1 FtsP/CotA-like multicopper oxidase with cupredoxin domain [Nonomuraea roseoviolacea subsp. carminata]